MKCSVFLTIFAMALACPSAHGLPLKKQIVYRYPDKDGVGQVWACPDRPPEVTAIGIDPPWNGCELFRPEYHYFEAGDIVQLWVYKFPLLSKFGVEIKGEQVYTPNLPFIRGVSGVPAAEQKKEEASAGKGLIPGATIPRFDAKQDKTVAAIDLLLAEISSGDIAKLKQAATLLKDLHGGATIYLRQAGPNASKARKLIDMLAGPRHDDYPGPSLEAMYAYAVALAGKWSKLNEGDTSPCVQESNFSVLADNTKLLIDAVTDYNARTKTLPLKEDFSKIYTDLETLSVQYDPIARIGYKILLAAEKHQPFKKIIDEALKREPSVSTASPKPPANLKEFGEKLGLYQDSAAPADAVAALNQLVDLTREAATYRNYRGQWDQAMQALMERPADINEKMRDIFATANSKYLTLRACGEQVINVKQWAGMAGANVVATEVPGFKLYSMAAVVNDQPETTKPNTPGQPAGAPSSTVTKPNGDDGSAGSSGNDGSGASNDDGREKPASGATVKADEPKPACVPICCCEPAKKPDASAASSAGGRTGSTVTVPVQVHQFARANLVAGFARSWLRTREYGIGQVGLHDAAGNPLLDERGGQRSIRSAVETKDQPSQYLYYVGLNYYLKRRDLHPQARNNNYRVPGLMFAYGVNQELNFLTGLNWELPWGVNLGGGAHFGRVTGLGNFGGIPGQTAIPDSVTTVPTVERFGVAPYLNIGFDGSVFGKVWGAVKGVKPAN